MKRWVCPECGAGKLAPVRPRRDDVRRYCLPCSERTGRLTERVAPSLERARTEQTERRKAQAARKRAAVARQREAQAKRAAAEVRKREVVVGVDIPKELERLWAVGLSGQYGKPWHRSVPSLTVRLQRRKLYASGHAYPLEHRITMTVPHDAVQVLSVLAHETAHLLAPEADHRQLFWLVLAELVEDAYGVRPDYRGARNRHDRDRRVEQAISSTLGGD